VTDKEGSSRPRILAAIVLYKQTPDQSATVASLARALQAPHDVDCHVFLYDNSPPATLPPPGIPAGFTYVPMPSNRGLYAPYEAARLVAGREGYDWLLTLDQDTALPENFFSAILPGLRAAVENPRIAAIVPHLADGDRPLSPALAGFPRSRPLPPAFSGVPEREVHAFNSAALLRTAALAALGGFEPCFWLDYLDNWLHHELFRQGWQIYVLDSVLLEHHFSLLNYRERVSLAHYRNFLGAEGAYTDLYESRPVQIAYAAQLAVRLVNQRRRGESPEILKATRRALWRRLTVSRARRLAAWRASLGGWPGAAQEAAS